MQNVFMKYCSTKLLLKNCSKITWSKHKAFLPGSAVYCVINVVFVNLLYFCILFFIVFRIHFYRISPLTRPIQQTHNFGFSLMTYNTLCILTGKINFCTVQRFHDKNAEIVWSVRWPIFSEFYDEDSLKRFA